MLVRELSVVESLFGLELELPALGKFWIQSTLRMMEWCWRPI